MNHDEARAFLLANQPVAIEADFDQATIDRVGEVLAWYRHNPIVSDLELLIRLPGGGDAGTYWGELGKLLIESFDHDEVLRVMAEVLMKGPEPSAEWASEELWSYVDEPAALDLYRTALASPFPGVRIWSARSLSLKGSALDQELLESAKSAEKDSEVLETIDEALNRLALHRK